MPLSLLPTIVIVSMLLYWVGVRSSSFLAERSSKFNLPSWLEQGLQLIVLVGLPYWLLIQGVIPAHYFGIKALITVSIANLQEISFPVLVEIVSIYVGETLRGWLPDLAILASTGTILAVFYLLCLWIYLQTIFIHENGRKNGSICPQVYDSNVIFIFDIAHWAFYRAAIWLMTDNLYLGVVGGILLIAIEQVIAARLSTPDLKIHQQRLLRFSLGLIAGTIFLYVNNLWLIAISQAILTWLTNGLSQLVYNFSQATRERASQE